MLKITNAWIMTQNEQRQVLKGDILASGTRIERIAKSIPDRAEVEVDAGGKLVLPGFVNAHTHLAMSLFRGLADDGHFKEAWEQKVWPAEKKLRPEHVLAGSRLGLLEMIRSGTTSFADMYFYPEETARACEELRVRALLTRTFLDKGILDGNPEHAFRALPKPTELVSWGISPHAPYTVSPENYQRAAEFAEKNKCRLLTHLSEYRWEVFQAQKEHGKRPVELLAEKNVLSERVTAAHCAWLTKQEVGMLGKHGASVAHCPVSNMKLASGGVAPVPEMLEAGVNVALGTDGCASNNSLSMLETMKFTALLHKHSRWDPSVVSAQQVLDFATRNGARALGLDSGSLEKGKLADYVMLDLRAPNLMPQGRDFASLVVYAANPSNITDVVVGGRFVMRDRVLLEGNEDEILAQAQKAKDELWS